MTVRPISIIGICACEVGKSQFGEMYRPTNIVLYKRGKGEVRKQNVSLWLQWKEIASMIEAR